MERIGAEAKVARATFYPHFPSKDDLVVAYLERIHQHIRARHELAVSSGEPPEDILREVAQQIVEESSGLDCAGARSSMPPPSIPTPTTRCTGP